jgi:hypothetical protein
MKHLFAMIFYNIVIRSSVMFPEDKNGIEKAYKEGRYADVKHKEEYCVHTVVDIYSTLGMKTDFRPKGLFQVGVTIKNSRGAIQHVGIRAVKPVMVVSY